MPGCDSLELELELEPKSEPKADARLAAEEWLPAEEGAALVVLPALEGAVRLFL